MNHRFIPVLLLCSLACASHATTPPPRSQRADPVHSVALLRRVPGDSIFERLSTAFDQSGSAGVADLEKWWTGYAVTEASPDKLINTIFVTGADEDGLGPKVMFLATHEDFPETGGLTPSQAEEAVDAIDEYSYGYSPIGVRSDALEFRAEIEGIHNFGFVRKWKDSLLVRILGPFEMYLYLVRPISRPDDAPVEF